MGAAVTCASLPPPFPTGCRWPFQALCDQLCLDVLHPLWEVRHGAAVALREVLSTHAAAAGVHAPLSAEPSGRALCGQYKGRC